MSYRKRMWTDPDDGLTYMFHCLDSIQDDVRNVTLAVHDLNGMRVGRLTELGGSLLDDLPDERMKQLLEMARSN